MQVQALQSVRDPTYLAALEARFAVAARHSRRVRFARIAIPAVIGLALLVVLGLSFFNPFRMITNLPIDIGKVSVSGTTITMEAPRMAGFTSDKRPYEIEARNARQDVKDPTNVDLDFIKGHVTMEDQSLVFIDARRGNFNNKTQLLHLQEKIFLKSSTGYEARLTDALVDMDKSSVHSDQPVKVKLLNGNLDANNLDIINNGALVSFGGGVSMDLNLDNDPAPAQTATSNASPAPVQAKSSAKR
jgi:lipopolysaccharide export system protein LptC